MLEHAHPNFKPTCKNGDPCHEPAPRVSKTGTQGLKNAKLRAVIPKKLCEHIVDICTKGEILNANYSRNTTVYK